MFWIRVIQTGGGENAMDKKACFQYLMLKSNSYAITNSLSLTLNPSYIIIFFFDLCMFYKSFSVL